MHYRNLLLLKLFFATTTFQFTVYSQSISSDSTKTRMYHSKNVSVGYNIFQVASFVFPQDKHPILNKYFLGSSLKLEFDYSIVSKDKLSFEIKTFQTRECLSSSLPSPEKDFSMMYALGYKTDIYKTQKLYINSKISVFYYNRLIKFKGFAANRINSAGWVLDNDVYYKIYSNVDIGLSLPNISYFNTADFSSNARNDPNDLGLQNNNIIIIRNPKRNNNPGFWMDAPLFMIKFHL